MGGRYPNDSHDTLSAALSRVGLLIFENLALQGMRRDEGCNFRQRFVKHNSRAATSLTSNRGETEGIAILDDALPAQSAAHCSVTAAEALVVEGNSYRPRFNPVVQDDDPPLVPGA